jgi:hypothetical protein
MPIRNSADVDRLIAQIDHARMRTDLDDWMRREIGPTPPEREEERQQILEAAISRVNPKMIGRYGIDVWDAMVLFDVLDRRSAPEEDPLFDDWKELYQVLGERAEGMNMEVSLQEDFDGLPNFLVGCDDSMFEQYVDSLESAPPALRFPFAVTVQALKGNELAGRKVLIQLKAAPPPR